MQKEYISLGLMSGTSGDGVDASIIRSNGLNHYEVLENRYIEYSNEIYENYHKIKEKIHFQKDLKKYSNEILDLERRITLFNAKVVKNFDGFKDEEFLVGFHGQTIYHNPKEKISYQLGDGLLLSQLLKKKIIYNFRKNDIINGGEGAPLAPIFHQLFVTKKNIEPPISILNIGGISNITIVKDKVSCNKLYSKDIGPGNCLIDNWVRSNSNKKFDLNGEIASRGQINEIILEQALELFSNRKNKDKLSYDINDFDVSFARGLSLEDGAITLTEFTARIIGESLMNLIIEHKNTIKKILLCGGGRKNKFLVKKIKKYIPSDVKLELIDSFGADGDFIESQAFAFLAIRSIKKLPISFPGTTGCKKPCSGGELIDY